MKFSLDELIACLNELRWVNSSFEKSLIEVDLKIVPANISEDGITIETLVLETNKEEENSTDMVVIEVFPVGTGMEPILTHVSKKRKVRTISKKI